MILTKRVALGGRQLDEIDDAIVIRSIDPGTTKESVSAVSRMGGSGQRVTGEHFDTLEASVTFAIDAPKKMLSRRREIFDQVISWALQKGWLTTNEMPDRRMYVDKVAVPNSGDLWNWTEEYTIAFRAYNVPFWQAELPATASGNVAASGTVTVPVAGNVQSVLDVTFQNRSGMTINNFWVQANGNRITLANLALGGSETLTISHGTDGLLRIRKGSVSVYDKYTGADDLFVNPGNVPVSFQADRAGMLTVQSCGRWV